MRVFFILVIGLSLIACDQKGSAGSTKDRARAEEEANNEVQQRERRERAARMEKDLSQRHFFYQAISGKFLGDVKIPNSTERWRIRITVTSSLAPYLGDRARELSEVEADLNNLYLNIQIVMWPAEDDDVAFGCNVSNIRPDQKTGQLVVTSSECPNLYLINIGDDSSGNIGSQADQRATELAEQLAQRTLTHVPRLIGQIQLSNMAAVYTFNAKKALE